MTPFIHFKDGGNEEIWMPAKPDKMAFQRNYQTAWLLQKRVTMKRCELNLINVTTPNPFNCHCTMGSRLIMEVLKV